MSLPVTVGLVGALAGVGGWLAAMGVRQRRRRRRLARLAGELGLSFSPSDPFALVRRHEAFALMQAGHDAQVDNVLFGPLGGWRARAFDYRYEIGHGPHRLIRRFSVVAVDGPEGLGEGLVWREPQGCPAPLPVEGARVVEGAWRADAGGERLARRVVAAWPGGFDGALGLECRAGQLLLSVPGALGRGQWAQLLAAVGGLLEALSSPPSRTI